MNKEELKNWVDSLANDFQIFMTTKDKNDCIDIKIFTEHKSDEFLKEYFGP